MTFVVACMPAFALSLSSPCNDSLASSSCLRNFFLSERPLYDIAVFWFKGRNLTVKGGAEVDTARFAVDVLSYWDASRRGHFWAGCSDV
ncbi:unnamed protein product [Ixodes pacificus]